MRYWIKKGAFLLGGLVFFTILLINMIDSDPFDPQYLVPAMIRAVLGGALFWFAGFILGDIVFKGVLNDIDENDKNNLLDGGLIQQVQMEKEKHVPGGEEYPYVEEKVTYQRILKKKKNQLPDMR